METKLYSFMDIFDTIFKEGQTVVQLENIIIPIIQRDYAQGRKSSNVTRIRDKFLESLYKAITEKPITLDFIYGDIDNEGSMTPLDGQQRLTTLFLFHWYAAKKGNIPKKDYDFLKKFSYETRSSTRDFCIELVDFNPNFEKTISEDIVNQAWFPLSWKHDPTISSMLVMLDAIDTKFKNVGDILWDKLKENCITFYFLPIKDMGLTDELYIKMNSRGKPLTLFEHFKAEFERKIRRLDKELAKRIIGKIDRNWTDLLWEYRKGDCNSYNDHIIDDKFLRYFKFICDVIYYAQDTESLDEKSNNEFELLRRYFSNECPNVIKNIEIMECFLDCWCDIPGYKSLEDFLKSFMGGPEHESGKIIVEESKELNIFKDCLHKYGSDQFPLNRTILLYAITIYLQNISQIKEDDFRRRIRIVNNLIQNSENEINNDSMRAILAQVRYIILNGVINDSIKSSFNGHQLTEENEKIKFLMSNPSMADTVFKLEDHPLLYGQVSIIGLENLDYARRFKSLFECSRENINRAMMAIGNYRQKVGSRGYYQYGSSSSIDYAWHKLFHKSRNSGFDNTKHILNVLLSTNEKFSDKILQKISDDYLQECESKNWYPFEYYYIRYPEYHSVTYGMMYNESAEETPYMFYVMHTRRNYNARQSCYPNLKAALDYLISIEVFSDVDEKLFSDYLGVHLLIKDDKKIICENNAYSIRNNEDDSEIDKIIIPQDNDGIDTEDRIVILKNYLQKVYNIE